MNFSSLSTYGGSQGWDVFLNKYAKHSGNNGQYLSGDCGEKRELSHLREVKSYELQVGFQKVVINEVYFHSTAVMRLWNGAVWRG